MTNYKRQTYTSKLYLWMCVKQELGLNLYPIAKKFDTQVGLVESKVKIEYGLCGFHRSENTFLQNLKKLVKSRNFYSIVVKLVIHI